MIYLCINQLKWLELSTIKTMVTGVSQWYFFHSGIMSLCHVIQMNRLNAQFQKDFSSCERPKFYISHCSFSIEMNDNISLKFVTLFNTKICEKSCVGFFSVSWSWLWKILRKKMWYVCWYTSFRRLNEWMSERMNEKWCTLYAMMWTS